MRHNYTLWEKVAKEKEEKEEREKKAGAKDSQKGAKVEERDPKVHSIASAACVGKWSTSRMNAKQRLPISRNVAGVDRHPSSPRREPTREQRRICDVKLVGRSQACQDRKWAIESNDNEAPTGSDDWDDQSIGTNRGGTTW